MGNSLKSAVAYLSDPCLVRRIQGALGVKQIIEEEEEAKSDNEHSRKSRESPMTRRPLRVEQFEGTANEIASNGVLKLATQAIGRQKKKRTVSPPSSPESMSPPREIVTVETYPLLDVYFHLATTTGYEPFYITFIPFICWNVDMLLARQMVVLWSLSMYAGQAIKCLFKWKRPGLPAIRLEDNPNLEVEYGFPSTHAIVSTVVPFYFLYTVPCRYEIPFWVMLCVSLTWWFSVCLSRLYLGVHTVLDILGGIFTSCIMLLILMPLLPIIDDYILNSSSFPVVGAAIIIFLMAIYPVEKYWTMDRGDTGAIIGGSFGVCLGINLLKVCSDDILTGPFPVLFPSLSVVGLCITRFVVGIMLLVPTRFVMKLLCFRLLPAIMPSQGVEEVAKRPLVELPYKLITYSTMGFNAVYLSQIVFEMSNINRW